MRTTATPQAIPQAIAEAVATMTAPYLGGITVDEVHKRLCPQEQKEKLLTVFEVRDSLRVSLPTVRRMLADGRLKKIQLGRAVRIPASSLAGLMH